jgi:DNA recombination protein RmuC
MTSTILILIAVIAVGIGIGFAIVLNRLKQIELARTNDQSASLLNQNLINVQQQLERGLNNANSSFQNSTEASQKLVRDVTEQLSQLQATNRRVQDFASQLQSLENVLRNPKHRGVLGEYFLHNMLQEVLPPGSFQLQHRFENGEIVDAAVFVGDVVIPIDAKFSLEHYNQMVEATDSTQREILERQFKADLKGRIDETAKYVRPDQQTTPFAFMYIPAEGIYASLLANDVGASVVSARDLLRYAFEKKVMIVGPTSFYAYLQSALQGINAHQVQKNIQPILDRVRQLGVHVNQFDHHMQRLGNQLGTTVRTYNTAYRELGKVDKDVMKLSEGDAVATIEPLVLDGPSQAETE